MRTAAAYLRHKRSAPDHGPMQREAVCVYAQENELALDDAHIYVDEQGINPTQEAFAAFLADARIRPVEVLLVHNHSRLSRNMETRETMQRQIDDLGVELVSVTQNPGGLGGKLLTSILTWVDDSKRFYR